MKLRDGLWLEGAYYIDIDQLGQLRIVGPDNHLHFGMVGIYHPDFEVQAVRQLAEGRVEVDISVPQQSVFLHDPVMGHMRKVRSFTEFDNKPTPTFAEVTKRHPTELEPNYMHFADGEITYRRLYGERWYGLRLQFPEGTKVTRAPKKRGFSIARPSEIRLKLIAEADRPLAPALAKVVADEQMDFAVFGKRAQRINAMWDRTAAEVTHLVSYSKTSGYEYGTVFPRDWMESADLGGDDFVPAALRYMYKQSMLHIDDSGAGWHEDIVGEYEYEEHQGLEGVETSLDDLVAQAQAVRDRLKGLVDRVRQLYINRNMVDIEPKYMMGIDRILQGSIRPQEMERLKKTAKYLMEQATQNDLITFKRLPDFFRRHRHDEEYFKAGNWRDSDNAFKMVHPVLAPYDVNVVLYPQALQAMRRHADVLGLDPVLLDRLIAKWGLVKDWYKFDNPDGTPAYALALYDIHSQDKGFKYKKLAVNHTDEAYELFYGDPSEEDVGWFAKRVIDPKYFYTKSGPTIVGANDGYTTEQYHGLVIWTKQTAYVVAGLGRQLTRSEKLGWSKEVRDKIKLAIEVTVTASINAFETLQTIPELHYDKSGEPRLYNDQPMANGPMNAVQLWSAVGARRIIKEYIKVAAHG